MDPRSWKSRIRCLLACYFCVLQTLQKMTAVTSQGQQRPAKGDQGSTSQLPHRHLAAGDRVQTPNPGRG